MPVYVRPLLPTSLPAELQKSRECLAMAKASLQGYAQHRRCSANTWGMTTRCLPYFPLAGLTSSVVGFLGSVCSSSSSSSSSSSRSAGPRSGGPRCSPSSPRDFRGSSPAFSSPASSPLLRPGQLSELGDPVEDGATGGQDTHTDTRSQEGLCPACVEVTQW